MASQTFIFAGGGTGGHLYPGLAVAEELLKRNPIAKVVFACSSRAIDRRILEALPYAIVSQPVRPFPSGVKGWGSFLLAWIKSATLIRQLVADLKPKAVLGLGGFAAAPVVSRAVAVGVPAALLNPDAVPGKANRMLAGRVDVIFTQFPATMSAFPPELHNRVRCVGCPVRSAFRTADRAVAIEFFGLRADRKTLLVFGGSLLSEALSEVVAQLVVDLGALADRWQLLHITGSPRAGEIEEMLRKGGLTVRTQGYCDRMELAYAAADLVVARAGAVTVAELAGAGRPAVLMPYPYHADQHQRLNAAALVDAGAAIICDDEKDPALNADNLREKLMPLMKDDDELRWMLASASALKGKNAAAEVANWLLNPE